MLSAGKYDTWRAVSIPVVPKMVHCISTNTL